LHYGVGKFGRRTMSGIDPCSEPGYLRAMHIEDSLYCTKLTHSSKIEADAIPKRSIRKVPAICPF